MIRTRTVFFRPYLQGIRAPDRTGASSYRLAESPKPAKRDRCAAHFRAGCGTRRHRRQSDPSRLPPCGYPTECQRTVSTHEGRGAGRWRRFLGRIRQPSHERSDDQADKEAMQTAVKNLVENAIHYSPEHTTVAVGVGERDGKVTIRVVDQASASPPNRWTAFSSDSTGSTGPFARDRRFGTRLGHHQALRAGERRSDFGLVAYGGGVDVHHRAAGRPG